VICILILCSHLHYKIWERSKYWLPLSEEDFHDIKHDQELLQQQMKEDAEGILLEDSFGEPAAGGESDTVEVRVAVVGPGIRVIVDRVSS
jgi:hypothetical protein